VPSQTIYQWRGSSVQGILTFQKRYPAVTTVKLEENFRSSTGIVETARPFIEQNAERLQKQMVLRDIPGFLVRIGKRQGDDIALLEILRVGGLQ
jgi:superfamily I DNA/RNA helicase